MGGLRGEQPSGFGQNLRRIRTEKGMVQRQVAEAAGVALSTYTAIEQGSSEPSWPLAMKIAEALGVDCREFTQPAEGGAAPLGETPEPTAPPKRGRPKKLAAEWDAPPAEKKPRGRPRKETGDQQGGTGDA